MLGDIREKNLYVLHYVIKMKLRNKLSNSTLTKTQSK